MYDLEYEVVCKFGYSAERILPCRDGLLIDTGNGLKLLKRQSLSPERILFVHGAKEHLHKNGFTHLDRYCLVNGLPYLVENNRIYTLADFPEGRECNFDNPFEMNLSARLLAQLHQNSAGYEPNPGVRKVSELGSLRENYQRHLEELKKLKKYAMKGKRKFDFAFISCVDEYYEMGSKALETLEKSGFERLVREAEKELSFCHRDYTYNNIFISGEIGYVINFEFCAYDIRVYDLANLIKRKMRKCNWNLKAAQDIINEYEKVSPLKPGEYAVMMAMFQFPQKFWRIANRYYNSRRSWTEKSYHNHIEDVLEEKDYLKEFLKGYRKAYGIEC